MNVLIKFSGEFFTEKDDLIKEGHEFLDKLVRSNLNCGYFVVGGGNRVRGANSFIDRNVADRLGVLSTIMNGIILTEKLVKLGQNAVLYSHFNDFGRFYSPQAAIKDYNQNKWVVLSSGLGVVGFVSTDLSAVVKSLELKVDAMIKITKVGGVYDKDPIKHSNAKLLSRVDYDYVLKNRLSVLDLAAMEIAAANNLPIGVISLERFFDFINDGVGGSFIGSGSFFSLGS